VTAEIEERWRAVKLVEEGLAAREAALRSAEQVEAQAARQPVAVIWTPLDSIWVMKTW